MQAQDLVEILCAAHLGSLVEGPFAERGGIMLVGPPAALKTTFVNALDRTYQDVVMMSDVNVKSLIRLRDAIASGKVNTLVLPEFAKIYERADVTAMNVEGTLRAMAAEGFSAASFEDSRINRLIARCLIMGALTPSTIDARFTGWEETGFNRRFLWCLMRLEDPLALERAAVNWSRIDFRMRHLPLAPLGEQIPNLTTHMERKRLSAMAKYQPGGDHALQIQLLIRILAVLRWWYNESGDSRDPMQTMESFAPALGKDGVSLELPKSKAPDREHEVKLASSNAATQLANKRWKGQGKKTKASNEKKKVSKK